MRAASSRRTFDPDSPQFFDGGRPHHLCVQVAKDARDAVIGSCSSVTREQSSTGSKHDWRNLMRRLERWAVSAWPSSDSVGSMNFRKIRAYRNPARSRRASRDQTLCQRVRAVLFGAAAIGFPRILFRHITQSIVRVIGSVTLSGIFTSGKTGHLWRCHDLFLAMNKLRDRFLEEVCARNCEPWRR